MAQPLVSRSRERELSSLTSSRKLRRSDGRTSLLRRRRFSSVCNLSLRRLEELLSLRAIRPIYSMRILLLMTKAQRMRRRITPSQQFSKRWVQLSLILARRSLLIILVLLSRLRSAPEEPLIISMACTLLLSTLKFRMRQTQIVVIASARKARK